MEFLRYVISWFWLCITWRFLAGEGNSDSAITVLGLIIGAAFAHNFGLASSGNGPTVNGQIAVVIGLIVTIFIAYFNTFSIKSK